MDMTPVRPPRILSRKAGDSMGKSVRLLRGRRCFWVMLMLPAMLAGCDVSRSTGNEPPLAQESPITVRHRALPGGDPDAPDHADLILVLHNRERERMGVRPLTWDARLARRAGSWAAQIGDSGILEHSGVDGEGENLWMGTAGRYAVEAMVGSWADERRDFRSGRFPAVSRSGDWSRVGHYSQMIWRDTQSVGCAINRGRQWDVLVCRYAPAGNVMGDQVP